MLAPTRWKLRQVVKTLNRELDALKLEKHPEKTFIGRIEKGFDFLGYRFMPQSLTTARKTMENFLQRALRLYEQELRGRFGSPQLESYVARWRRWATAGLEGCPVPATEDISDLVSLFTSVAAKTPSDTCGRVASDCAQRMRRANSQIRSSKEYTGARFSPWQTDQSYISWMKKLLARSVGTRASCWNG